MAGDPPYIPPAPPRGPAGNFVISSIGLIARALRNPNYAVYVAGNSVSLVGTWMQRIGVGWLTWELTVEEGDIETRLSILAGWVLAAENAQLSYGLSLPDQYVQPAIGAAHRERCLEILALFGHEKSSRN